LVLVNAMSYLYTYRASDSDSDDDVSDEAQRARRNVDVDNENGDAFLSSVTRERVPEQQERQQHQKPSENWNERFQELLGQNKVDDDEHANENQNENENSLLAKSAMLRRLCVRFAVAAESDAVAIVRERALDVREKTLRPSTSLAGVAGGVKYENAGIVYKFAIDSAKLYGGDAMAMKSASAELRSMMSLLELRIGGLHFPLCALVHYRGVAVVAQSLLPIDGTTLRYGSMDGARTVHASHEPLNRRIELAASMLNLAAHTVWNTARTQSAVLHTCGDLEGHVGRDGRLYCIDTARLFPPVTPLRGARSSYLYWLMRPEFVRHNPVPLSSDAFSPFGKRDERAIEHDQAARAATNRLETDVIAQFAALLDKRDASLQQQQEPAASSSSSASIDDANVDDGGEHDSDDELASLVGSMHFAGINCRYLMMLLCQLKSHAQRRIVATELVARTVKNCVRAQWRSLSSVDDEPYRRVFAEHWNGLFSDDADYWRDTLLVAATDYFRGPLRRRLKQSRRAELMTLVRKSLLAPRVQLLLGVRLSARRVLPLHAGDVEEMRAVIKHMSRLTFDEGTALSRAAMTKPPAEADQLLARACTKYHETLLIRPNDHRALANWALTLQQRAKLCVVATTADPERVEQARIVELHRRAAKLWRKVALLHASDNDRQLLAKALAKWGAGLLELADQLKRTPVDSALLLATLRRAARKLDAAISCQLASTTSDADACSATGAAASLRYAIRYNCGTAHLQLANLSTHLRLSSDGGGGENTPIMTKSQVMEHLSLAIERFGDARRVVAGTADEAYAMRNEAVARARLARLRDDGSARQRELFESADALHERVCALLTASAEAHFDWANSLLRRASILLALGDDASRADVAPLIERAVAKYARALDLCDGPFRAAFVNMGLAVERIVATSSSAHVDAAVGAYLERCGQACARGDAGLKSVEAFGANPLLAAAESRAARSHHRRRARKLLARVMPDTYLPASSLKASPERSSPRATSSGTRGRRRRSSVAASGVDLRALLAKHSARVETPWPPSSSRINVVVYDHSAERNARKSKRGVPLSGAHFEALAAIPSFTSFNAMFAVRHVDDARCQSSRRRRRVYALKVVLARYCELPERLELVSSPFVLPLRFAFQSAGCIYFVYDHMAGSLFDFDFFADGRAPVDVDTARFYLAELLCALPALGRFKLRPHNVLLDWHGHLCVSGLPRLDASALRVAELSSRNVQSVGSLADLQFIAPEVARGTEPDDCCDAAIAWTFGVVAHRLLAGCLPFDELAGAGKSVFQALFDPAFRVQPPAELRNADAVSLLASLLEVEPTRRLCSPTLIMQHRFFANVDWPAVLAKQLAPPFVPSKTKLHRKPPLAIDLRRFGLANRGDEVAASSSSSSSSSSDASSVRQFETYVAPALLSNADWAGNTIVNS
jgi:serine/threonine protein kinase